MQFLNKDFFHCTCFFSAARAKTKKGLQGSICDKLAVMKHICGTHTHAICNMSSSGEEEEEDAAAVAAAILFCKDDPLLLLALVMEDEVLKTQTCFGEKLLELLINQKDGHGFQQQMDEQQKVLLLARRKKMAVEQIRNQMDSSDPLENPILMKMLRRVMTMSAISNTRSNGKKDVLFDEFLEEVCIKKGERMVHPTLLQARIYLFVFVHVCSFLSDIQCFFRWSSSPRQGSIFCWTGGQMLFSLSCRNLQCRAEARRMRDG